MRNQINLIAVAETKQIFNEKLVQSLKEYTEQFVLPQLSHYAERPNLGRGIECFVNAIKACAEEALIESALKELSSVLPSKSPQGESFLNKFRQLLTLANSKTLIKPT